jgi:hypothetical protein
MNGRIETRIGRVRRVSVLMNEEIKDRELCTEDPRIVPYIPKED